MRSYTHHRTDARLRLTVACACLLAFVLAAGLSGWADGQTTVIRRTGPGGETVTEGSPSPPTPTPPGSAKPGEEKKADEDKEGDKKPEESDKPIAVFIPEKPDGDKLISMSFDQADIDHVLKFLAEQSGKTIVKEPSVQTKVTIVSTAKITVADAFQILSALLSVKGFSVMEDDNIVRVVPRKSAMQEAMQVREGDGDVKRSDRYVTHILQVEHIDAAKLKDDLKPLVPEEQGFLIANADTNTLVIIDTEANVARLLDIITALDTDRAEVREVDVIQLEFADAEELAEELKELFEKESPMAGLPADVQRRMREAMSRSGGGGQPGAMPGMGGKGLLDVRGEVKIVAEKRTNSLFVAAAEANLKTIKDLVTKVDVDMRPEVAAKIVSLKYADPETVAQQINQLFEEGGQFSRRGGSFFSRMFRPYYSSYGSRGRGGGATEGLSANRVVPDLRTRSLIVTADEENMKSILELITQLDISAEIEDVVKAIPLENAVADDVADTINNLIRGSQRGGGFFFFALMGSGRGQGGEAPLDQLQEVNVVADSPTNTILLTGPPETFSTLERLIKQLDRRVPQVYIEVLIADVTLDDSNRMGVEWSLIDRNLLGHSSASGALGTAWDGLRQVAGGLSYSIISNSVQAFLRTLETRSDVEILSSPNIMALDNKPATISIGESIPYQESTRETASGSIQQTVDFIDVTNTLEVTPHVNQRKRITLEVTQTVDALISFDEKLLAPRIAKREAETTVEVRDGQTIILGGIISERRSVVIQGVPILRKIPILGKLFEDKKKESTRSELLVFLTPHIIIEDDQVDALTELQAGRLSTNPLEDEDFRPLDLPLADFEDREWTIGPETKPAEDEAEKPAPETPAPAQP